MTEHCVLTGQEDGVGTITFNQPATLNAFSSQMMDELIEVSAAFERDPSVRCVVLQGAGSHFMAGGDVKGFHKSLVENRKAHVDGRETEVIRAHQFIYQLRRMPKPVLASVHGIAAGIGLSIVLATDLAIASADAVFTLAYRHVGLSPDGGSTYFLPRILGERKALELAFLGDRFTAQAALDLGIVNWLAPRELLQEETARIARRLADGPTIALAEAKRLIRSSFDNSWDEQSHREAESFAIAAGSDDHFDGAAAFVEKRKAAFHGR
jgi:2-(1,2-epoxy-1,2-dihydrophenyl)acetyl-CoA isomerase